MNRESTVTPPLARENGLWLRAVQRGLTRSSPASSGAERKTSRRGRGDAPLPAFNECPARPGIRVVPRKYMFAFRPYVPGRKAFLLRAKRRTCPRQAGDFARCGGRERAAARRRRVRGGHPWFPPLTDHPFPAGRAARVAVLSRPPAAARPLYQNNGSGCHPKGQGAAAPAPG